MIGYAGLAIVIALMVIGVPLWVSFALGAIAVLAFDMGVPTETLAQMAFSSVDSYPLLACPLFVLSGALLVRGGAMEPMQRLIGITIARVHGGLPCLVIVTGAILGAISGSAGACLAILAIVVLPLFQPAGYTRAYGAGIALASAELGLIIPPSIFLILFGAFNQVSIIDLFSGGLAGGLLIAACMLPVAIFMGKRSADAVAMRHRRASDADVRALLLQSAPLLGFPVLVLGGIYGGVFSPTESASVATMYALFLGVAVYRKLSAAEFTNALAETASLTGMIYMIILGADLFSRMLSFMQIPQAISALVVGIELDPTLFLLVVVAFLVFVGFFFSSLPMVVTVLPLFMPTVKSLGIDPVVFGVIGVICASFGEMTPPFGPQLWVAEPLCRVPMGQIFREVLPFLAAWIVALVIMVLFPDLIIWAVHLLR